MKNVKRAFDVITSATAIIILSPVFIALIFLIRIRLGSPVFFKQRRPGLNSEPFTMFKFRTMTDKRDNHGQLLPDVDRITKLGAFLRSTSLDELPELWNVLKGDMSLVGPRPLLMEYLSYYSPEEQRRHEVRPGITGLAQISGRNNLKWDERLKTDVDYVKRMGLILDLKIILKTIKMIFKKSDVVIIPATKQEKLSEIREKRNKQ